MMMILLSKLVALKFETASHLQIGYVQEFFSHPHRKSSKLLLELSNFVFFQLEHVVVGKMTEEFWYCKANLYTFFSKNIHFLFFLNSVFRNSEQGNISILPSLLSFSTITYEYDWAQLYYDFLTIVQNCNIQLTIAFVKSLAWSASFYCENFGIKDTKVFPISQWRVFGSWLKHSCSCSFWTRPAAVPW